jgi:cytochrome c oxidase assembly protein subunit 15
MNTGQTTTRPHDRLYKASWALIIYTIIIIAWGAWVRISGSGDGCGDHWPLCHGAAIPLGGSTKTWTEVAHRYSTAIFGVFVLAQLFAIRRLTDETNSARRWVWWTLLFTATEALIGRMLVTKGLVNESTSLSRMYVMPLHLVNTSLLLFSEVMTAESLAFGTRARIRGSARRWSLAIAASLLLLLTTGAIAALGSHLLPAASLTAGLAADLAATSHPAVRLRILHPILGLLIPLGVFLYLSAAVKNGPPAHLKRIYRHFATTAVCMIVLGIATLTLLAPTWLKLAHLTMANVLVVLAARCFFHASRPEAIAASSR